MSDLIVPFPKQRINRFFCKKPAEKMVQFSPTLDICFFQRIESNADKSKIWYTKKDTMAIKLATNRAIQEVHMKGEISTESCKKVNDVAEALLDSFCTTGIENVLTPEIMRKVRAAKGRCRTSVLLEQERQDASGEYDPDRLASISQQCSVWSVQRSITIGLLHRME